MKNRSIYLTATMILCLTAAASEQMIIATGSSVGRAPASAYAPNEELIPTPAEKESWLAEIMVEDQAGVMKGVRSQLQEWQEREEYARIWNLEDSGIVDVPERGEKQKLITKNALKYIDKRISGEIKNAEEGSTFHKVGQAQKALKPESEVGVSENFKLKFKARVLEQKATMLIVNPYVDADTEVKFNGKAKLNVRRDFASVGVHTQMEYHVDSGELNVHCEKKIKEIDAKVYLNYRGLDNEYIAAIDKSLAPKLTGRISSTQSPSDVAFTKNADSRLEFFYSSPF